MKTIFYKIFAIMAIFFLHMCTSLNTTSINRRISMSPIEDIDRSSDDMANLMSVVVKLNELKKIENMRSSYLHSAFDKRTRYATDYTLSDVEKKKIDQAAITAFKKLKKYYVVASRSRFGR